MKNKNVALTAKWNKSSTKICKKWALYATIEQGAEKQEKDVSESMTTLFFFRIM